MGPGDTYFVYSPLELKRGLSEGVIYSCCFVLGPGREAAVESQENPEKAKF